jgi:hypothetical protein
VNSAEADPPGDGDDSSQPPPQGELGKLWSPSTAGWDDDLAEWEKEGPHKLSISALTAQLFTRGPCPMASRPRGDDAMARGIRAKAYRVHAVHQDIRDYAGYLGNDLEATR